MKLSLFQLSCTVALCLFFSTVNNVVEGQLLRGGSTMLRQLQDDGEMVAEEAKGTGGNLGEKEKKEKNDEKKVTMPKKVTKPKKSKKPRKTRAPRPSLTTTGDVADEQVTGDAQEAMVFVVDSNSTLVDDDDDIFSNSTVIDDDDIASNSTAVDDDDIASNSTAVDDIASNSTADDELDESDADEEEGEGEVRY
mmetsp:Transcript_48076/g.54519  ORF Transcript_48076/g.54519 Transcript_48076/m.54519 type:complete len:194 (+) Transcript_48076:127-708(+)